ncbi:MAG: T9SS type A sorting domain-containing protein [Bacteroidota bacterium]
MRALILLAISLVASSALAQAPGTYTTGTAIRFLDASNVQASLFTTGGLFFGGSTTSGNGYIVPKVSGNSPIFAAGIWLSGTVNGEIRVAAARYGGYDFWPGPLNDDGTLPNPSDCSAYDRIWVVNSAEIGLYESGQSPARDLAEWPVGLGAPTVDAEGEPVEIRSRTQVIDLDSGERPDLLGSQMAFWVMNDAGNDHNPGMPLGVEIQATAFVTVNDALPGAPEASFYRFRIVNRSPNTIENARWSFFTDPDLGDAGDDYVGTDTLRNMAFAYNDSNEDGAYGSPPPAVGYTLLNHELAATSTFIGGGPAGTQDPGTPQAYYFYMQGLWGNGTPYYEFGSGYEQPGIPITTFIYAGDPVTESVWSEVNVDGNGTDSPQGDRRLLATAALGNLAPGEAETVDLAIVFAFGTDRLDSITQIRAVSDGVQAAYDDGTLFQRGAPPVLLDAPQLTAPANGADLARVDTRQFSWTAVDGAEQYQLQWDSSPDGSFSSFRRGSSPTMRVPARDLGPSGTQTIYWRVTALASGAVGSVSEVRSVTYFRGGALTLPSGQHAYVEVANAEGTDPCGAEATSTSGCDQIFGNLVHRSLNSTASYYVSEDGIGSEDTIGIYAPSDFEIRFTDTGSLGIWRAQDGAIARVPFEVWDVGPVTPGESNDPSDDVQLIPVLFADAGGTCTFNYGEIEEEAVFGYPATDRILASYPATSYTDFEAAFGGLVESASDRCYLDGSHTADVHLAEAPYPIQNQVFADFIGAGVLPGTGTVVRMYTADPLPVSVEDVLQSGDLVLGAASPNPTASSLTVPYCLVSSSPVELAVYDVLGRRVLELVNARQLEGSHTATLDASALAPGVYLIQLRAGEDTRTTRVTIVR